jgi:hypothetical protein
MAATRRERRYREVRPRARPKHQDIAGEKGLIAAVLRQALADATSTHVDRRNEARWFLQDEQAVAFWLDLAEIDHQTFQAHVQRALGPG